mgnify:CR=1 FL=1
MSLIKDKLKKWKNMSSFTLQNLRHLDKLSFCGLCHEETRRNDLLEVDSNLVCNECYGELPKCSHCGHGKMILDNATEVCSQCVSSKHVRRYGHKPYAVFHRVSRSGRVFITDSECNNRGKVQGHFGVECEIDGVSESTALKLRANGLASVVNMIGNTNGMNSLYYVKEDGSLDIGAEIVSHPFSWRFWKRYGYDIYDTLFDVIKKAGYFSQETSTCGMHIHYTKNALSELTLYKMLLMVYMESDFMTLISQREESGLADWCSVKPSSILGYNCPDISDSRYKKKVMQGLRYVARHKRAEDGTRGTALNITSQTVEMRLFKGTINIMTFAKNIEFLRSLIMFCRESSISDVENKNRVKTFIHYLDNNQTRYPNLCWFLGHYAKEQAGVKGSFSQNKEKWARKYMLDLNKIDFFSDTKGVN